MVVVFCLNWVTSVSHPQFVPPFHNGMEALGSILFEKNS